MSSRGIMGVLVCALVLAVSTACSVRSTDRGASDDKTEKSPTGRKINVADILQGTDSPEEKSASLTSAGEALMIPSSFHQASEVFEIAVQLDPNNKKAQSYLAFLKPVKLSKGIMNRIAPLVSELSQEVQDNYALEIERMKESKLSINEFLLDGPQDISTVSDLQAHIDSLYDASNEARLFFKNNKDSEFSIKVQIPGERKVSYDCEWDEYRWRSGNTEYVEYTEYCESKKEQGLTKIQDYLIARAELTTFEQMASGMMVYLAGYTAYDGNGALSVYSKLEGNELEGNEKVTQEEFTAAVKENPQLGLIRDRSKITSIKELGHGLVDAIRWANSMQSDICKAGDVDLNNRPGYLFDTGLCVNDKTVQASTELNSVQHLVARALTVIEGGLLSAKISVPTFRMVGVTPTYRGYLDRDNRSYETDINPGQVINNPVEDLKPLMPVEFESQCGTGVKAGDPSLGGLFPAHDADRALEAAGVFNNLDCLLSDWYY